MQIIEAAARWVAEEDTDLLTPETRLELADWLAADPLHRQAYERARRLWSALDAIEDTPGMRPVPEPVVPAPTQTAPRRVTRVSLWRKARPSRKAAAMSVTACGAIIALLAATDLPLRLQADAITSIGEQRLVPLPDGSTIQLNTHSAVAVDYSPTARHVALLEGEAAFAVRPDPARPFTVEAKGGTARALGTRFMVRMSGDGAAVTVTEHRVRIALGSAHRDIGEGQRLAYNTRLGLKAVELVIPADADAWTRGRLVAVNRPLGEVVAEINRYHRGYIRVAPEIAKIPVSGNFRMTDPVAALEQIQKALGLSCIKITNMLIYIHKV